MKPDAGLQADKSLEVYVVMRLERETGRLTSQQNKLKQLSVGNHELLLW